MVAQANQSELTHTVTIRYQAQFADTRYMATLRILHGSRIFNIHAAIDLGEQHKWIELPCSEGLNDG
jgi:SPP1 family predicted phage head-tail adaptor